jgi:uncharacterized SAM-binding protein YcdF (DUF218 family)
VSRRLRIILLIDLAVLVVTVTLMRTLLLSTVGATLVHSQQPSRADYAVVLAGDFEGNRILKGAELVRQGFVRKAVIDGPAGAYGLAECDLAVDFAVKKGYPADYFLKLPMRAKSTQEEAERVIPELRRLGARSFLLVTSEYHTRRAEKIFRKLAPEIEMRVIAAPDEYFRPDSWWRNREGRKIVYIEWSKTVASWFGI